MADIKDLRFDDQCYVLNSHQTAVSVAFVKQGDDRGIRVFVPGKNEDQWFDWETGLADVAVEEGEEAIRAILLHPEDWRVTVIQTRKIFKNYTSALRVALDRLTRNPSTDNAFRVQAGAAGLEAFVKTADPVALRANSIPDYLQLAKQ